MSPLPGFYVLALTACCRSWIWTRYMVHNIDTLDQSRIISTSVFGWGWFGWDLKTWVIMEWYPSSLFGTCMRCPSQPSRARTWRTLVLSAVSVTATFLMRSMTRSGFITRCISHSLIGVCLPKLVIQCSHMTFVCFATARSWIIFSASYSTRAQPYQLSLKASTSALQLQP